MENVEINDSGSDVRKIYEVGYHIVPTVSEEDLPREVGNIKDLIESNGGLFISDDFPKLKGLAFEISKHVDGVKHDFDQAYFGWVKFEVSPDSLVAIKKGLDGNANILRYILIETVRENTMSFIKPAPKRDEEGGTEEQPKAERPAEITAEDEERIAKSIDELIKE